MVRLRIGNSFDGHSPSKAVLKEFRAGQRELTEYTFKTLPLDQLNPKFPKSKEITVDEIKRFFDRTSQPRMTTGATMFANLCDVDEKKWYSRMPDERMYGDFSDSIRAYGASSIADESIGLQFRLYRVDAGNSANEAYFDNSKLEVSNILWEFSSDGGDKWYPLYDLPNRAYTRITLPKRSSQLKVRALSNNLEDWVQAFAITPKPDFQKIGNENIEELQLIGDLEISRFGYLSWSGVKGNAGNVMYEIYKKEETKDKLLDTVIGRGFQLNEFDVGDEFYIIAVDELGNRVQSNVVVYKVTDLKYRWLNYNLVSYNNSSTFDEENGTFSDDVDGLDYIFGPPNVVVGEEFFIDQELIGEFDQELAEMPITGYYEKFTKKFERPSGDVVITELDSSQFSDDTLNGFSDGEDGSVDIDDAYIGGEVDRYTLRKDK